MLIIAQSVKSSFKECHWKVMRSETNWPELWLEKNKLGYPHIKKHWPEGPPPMTFH